MKYKNKLNCDLYSLALDIGVSQSTLYNYLNDYKKVSQKLKEKIENYLKKVDKLI